MVPRPALRFRAGLLLSALASALAVGCGNPSGPGPVPPAPPQIICPAPVTISGVVGTSQPVTYTPPTVTGGAAPVNVSCSRSSGSTFPLGQTTVTCTATDSQSRSATCSMAVTLTHQQLSLTRYLAFGDSITEGQNGRPFIAFVDTANAYPTFLQTFFSERIPSQQITVVNAGRGGERVADPATDRRLKDEIARHQPEVLLLLHGINDINNGASSQTVANALRDHIRTARERGVAYVFISTLTPVAPDVCTFPNPGDPRCRALDTPPGQPQEVNERIRAMVGGTDAHLVDPYDEFVARRREYIDTDGLHLSPAGNRALATAFWDRIVSVVPAAQLFGDSPYRIP